jgi:primosomal protein N' (replication factor Y) (superfamily II helicase)
VGAARAVRIITEVAAVDRPFDYLVTERTQRVAVGDRVRVDFNGRSVRGWVTGEATAAGDLKPLTKWLGYGPPATLLELLAWASERWYSPLSRFLVSTSPKRLITDLPVAPQALALAPAVMAGVRDLEPGVLEVAPTTDPLGLILAAYEATRDKAGSLLVLVPTESWAGRLRGRLEQRGCAVASGEDQWDRMRAGWPVVVGARGAALAPVPQVCGAVVIDADDESYRNTATPTWDAVSMLRERCRRDGAPLWCTSSLPSPALLNDAPYRTWGDVSGGWPRVDVVDRRNSDPHDGVLARESLDAAHRALNGDEPVAVVVVLQRLGDGRLFACAKCGELARCAVCGQAEEEVDGQLACRDRHEPRANFCRSCGSTNLHRLRLGVTTLARDVGAQLAQIVSEVTANSELEGTLQRVVVGTEAVWQRVRHCGVVIFVDFDQYLLAPRASARHSAITAVGKAGRLVGPRREGRGAVVLQTRRSDDPVIDALVRANFDEIIDDDVKTARLLELAPYGAEADVSGEGAQSFVDGLREYKVSIRPSASGFVVRAADVVTLTAALRAVTRPATKVRVAVR